MNTFRVLVLFVALLLTTLLPAQSRDARWKSVEEAVSQGLPRTAIGHLETIIPEAMAERAFPEAIKAITRKIALEGNIEGNKPEEKIVRLQAEIEKAPQEMKPMMEAILARWYWHYFQQNRWRFLQRTQTAEPPGDDIQTWDLARILREIDQHFTAALADEATLKATPVAQFDDLLERGSVPDSYRPTLFDFVAFDALEFYQAGEQAAVQAEDEFLLEAEGPIFADAFDFLTWQLPPRVERSSTEKAVVLFQRLLQFHHGDADRSAFFDADLARLAFGHNSAVGEDREARSARALERFIESTQGHEVQSRAIAVLAGRIHAAGDALRAHALARRGRDAHPGSAGGVACHNLIETIEARFAQLDTEAVWNAPWPTLNVTYRNITQVHFRAIPYDFERVIRHSRWGWNGVDDKLRAELLEKPAALIWSADLPPTDDFSTRIERLAAPTSLKPGYYFILASHDRTFGGPDDQLTVAGVWVSDLALVTQLRVDGRPHAGLVVNARSGEPVPEATVRIWRRDDEGWFRAAGTTATDADGRFEIPSRDREIVVLAEHGQHGVSSARPFYTYASRERERAEVRTVFFTDRALYRPGQAVHYKGVTVRLERDAGRYGSLSGRQLTVVFNDPNGKEIARAAHTTNDFGSFHGVFTAPRDRLMGAMSLQVLGGTGATSVHVEEYKRPKFEVELAAPAEAARLGDPVRLSGMATAYSGTAIGGASVKWRVERSVQMPYWCWWWQPPAVQAIAHGTAVTDPDGSFTIEFTATPDRSVPEKNEPIFAYRIHADVTDTTGETRSDDRTVRAGYTALQALVSAEEWQVSGKPVVLRISTQSVDGEPQAAEGHLRVHALVQPARVERAPLQPDAGRWPRPLADPAPDPSNPGSWESAAEVASQAFQTKADGAVEVPVALQPGIFRVSLEIKDRSGRAVTARHTVHVVDPGARTLGVRLPNYLGAPSWSTEPGRKLAVLWGTGYESGRAFVELEYNGKTVRRGWTAADRTQELIEEPVVEGMRGGITLRVTFVRENRAYLNERVIQVPWTNKALSLKWESFRSKLLPGAAETWTATITGPDAQGAAAEMVASLYDASLDQYMLHAWGGWTHLFRTEQSLTRAEFHNVGRGFNHLRSGWHINPRHAEWTYRHLPPDLVENLWGYGFYRRSMAMPAGADGDEQIVLSPFEISSEAEGAYMASSTMAGTRLRGVADAISVVTPQSLKDSGAGSADSLLEYTTSTEVGGPHGSREARPDLSKVSARKNLNETAFFFPQLLSDASGAVKLQFTMPEALTEWRFLGFAHDAQLRSGLLGGTAVTAKDLMVEPNPPRFVREGDAIEFTVKVSNQTDQPQTGVVRLTFADAATLQSVDTALGNTSAEQTFDVPAKQSLSYSWRIAVPDGMGFLTYKAVGASMSASDGEEGFLPVLSRRVFVRESLPLPIRGKGERRFEFTKLLESGRSDTLRHQSLTVQMVSQPAWYAVMALPYLMEYPYECSEQVFNRYYANALARHIARSDPKIRRIFDLWRNTSALDSPLEKNEDLKSVLIEETPWLREAANESRARRNVGLLFEDNRLEDETARTLHKLSEQQLSDGLWSWFPGGRPSEFISLYIVAGFGRLRNLGVAIETGPALRAVRALDAWMDERYRDILRQPHPQQYVPSHIDALYLYGRSFFLADQPVDDGHRDAVDFFLQRSREHWLEVDCRQCQAHLALGLHRFGDRAVPPAIMRSIKERSVTTEELGMFWRDLELSWWWFRAPIETQAIMIEAFAEVMQDEQAVEDCKVWLLKQKQTQDWKTTKATADAVYALLLRGDSPLASDALVEVALGRETIRPENVEAGTGFYEQKFVRGEIHAAMGDITVTKVDDGVSWGSVHWQYLEDMAKVTPHEATPLRLKKTLYVKENSSQGPILKPVTGVLGVGDELVVRIELRTDRDMEYVHLKDQRGSGTEPVNVLSRYRFQDGLAYYESTRDTASHFFIDYLPKGVYVFEYSTRVQLKGAYQTGIAEIQCMYAPEFGGHSESFVLEVR